MNNNITKATIRKPLTMDIGDGVARPFIIRNAEAISVFQNTGRNLYTQALSGDINPVEIQFIVVAGLQALDPKIDDAYVANNLDLRNIQPIFETILAAVGAVMPTKEETDAARLVEATGGKDSSPETFS